MLNVEMITDVKLIEEEIRVTAELINELYPTARTNARQLMRYKARLERRLNELNSVEEEPKISAREQSYREGMRDEHY